MDPTTIRNMIQQLETQLTQLRSQLGTAQQSPQLPTNGMSTVASAVSMAPWLTSGTTPPGFSQAGQTAAAPSVGGLIAGQPSPVTTQTYGPAAGYTPPAQPQQPQQGGIFGQLNSWLGSDKMKQGMTQLYQQMAANPAVFMFSDNNMKQNKKPASNNDVSNFLTKGM